MAMRISNIEGPASCPVTTVRMPLMITPGLTSTSSASCLDVSSAFSAVNSSRAS